MSHNVFHLSATEGDHVRIRWISPTDDLHMNVIDLRPGEEIGEHTNHALDVIGTCLQGSGIIEINQEVVTMEPGSIALIPRGVSRRIEAGAAGIIYTTVHRKRGGLMPTVQPQ